MDVLRAISPRFTAPVRRQPSDNTLAPDLAPGLARLRASSPVRRAGSDTYPSQPMSTTSAGTCSVSFGAESLRATRPVSSNKLRTKNDKLTGFVRRKQMTSDVDMPVTLAAGRRCGHSLVVRSFQPQIPVSAESRRAVDPDTERWLSRVVEWGRGVRFGWRRQASDWHRACLSHRPRPWSERPATGVSKGATL